MITVFITGWQPGFEKIQTANLLREQFGYSLGDAKAAVDKILERQPISLNIPEELREKLALKLAELNVEFYVQN